MMFFHQFSLERGERYRFISEPKIRCLLLVVFGEHYIYQNLKDFTRIEDSCYRVDVTFHKINKFFNSKFYFLLGRQIDYTVSSNFLMVLFPISKYCFIKDFCIALKNTAVKSVYLSLGTKIHLNYSGVQLISIFNFIFYLSYNSSNSPTQILSRNTNNFQHRR